MSSDNSDNRKRTHDEIDSDSDDDYGPMPVKRNVEPMEVEEDEETKQKRLLREKKRKIMTEKLDTQRERLPCASMYEKSYMHREEIRFSLYTKTDYLITGSTDGVIKFWKKNIIDLDFAKGYQVHEGTVIDGAVDLEGKRFASIGVDKTISFFTVELFDLTHSVDLPFTPTSVEWLSTASSVVPIIAIGDSTGVIHIYNVTSGSFIAEKKVHGAPVHIIRRHPSLPLCISADMKGNIDMWCNSNEDILEYFVHPSKYNHITYQFRLKTDLVLLLKTQAKVTDIKFSPDGRTFIVDTYIDRSKLDTALKSDTSTNLVHALHLFTTQTGTRRLLTLDDSEEFARSCSDSIEVGSRMTGERAIERIIQNDFKSLDFSKFPRHTVVFDVSGCFFFSGSIEGIKAYDIMDGKTQMILGKVESNLRFLSLALFQGFPKTTGEAAVITLNAAVLASAASDKRQEVCSLFSTAYNSDRFFVFTQDEPESLDRDENNEKPLVTETIHEEEVYEKATQVTLHTNEGDIVLNLFPAMCPKTVHNFVSLCKAQKYDNNIFHRVIDNFMIQTGDYENFNGTGGNSIFGESFEDEFHPSLTFVKSGYLAMANKGPNTNGSQFFITLSPQIHLNNKHTIFGQVADTSSMGIVRHIGKAKVNSKDRPITPIRILCVNVKE